jgi:hypothetical protein
MKQAYGSALSSEPLSPGKIHSSFITNFIVTGYANDEGYSRGSIEM